MIDGLKIELIEGNRINEAKELINSIFKVQSLLEKYSMFLYKNQNKLLFKKFLNLLGYGRLSYWGAISGF